MSGQAESRHFFRIHDIVEDPDGAEGVVVASSALYAVVRWSNGMEDEIDQFEPSVLVVMREGNQ
jgi:hypothetical protein